MSQAKNVSVLLSSVSAEKNGLDNLSFALASFVDASGTFAHGISKLDPSLLQKLSFFSFFVESHFLTRFFILTIHCHLYVFRKQRLPCVNSSNFKEKAKYFRAVRRLFAQLDRNGDGGSRTVRAEQLEAVTNA